MIFEAKTITDSNETAQCRDAFTQLPEYRLEYGQPDDLPCLAVDRFLSPRRVEILQRLGIAVVGAGDQALEPLNAAGVDALAPPPRHPPQPV